MAEKNVESQYFLERVKEYISALKAPVRPVHFEGMRSSLEGVLKQVIVELGIDELGDIYTLGFVDIIGSKVFMEFNHPHKEDTSIYTLPVSVFETVQVIKGIQASNIDDKIEELEDELTMAKGIVAKLELQIARLQYERQALLGFPLKETGDQNIDKQS